ncbi:MAG: serine/threonine-protein kinase [Myxococcota bacterium]|nr:serine/threonine-protein kinase [Myxococcota bacterium]
MEDLDVIARPATIGRYEIVGQLALGGMAQILLGRLLGPSGFERVVVIKRILPNLAQERAFTEMFLDEARIAAAIHHPNVVQVHELGETGGDLYLVMEYLQGESLSGLLRRLRLFGESLDPSLVAHIGAEACAGLHAAHELRDADGRPVGLVHRDISPQNIFISYDGAVKILDFGIAKAADRITQTEAGVLKGKFAYMSPEQCLGEPPDRRSDLFALGAVLFEAATGRRLFQRQAQLQTLRAVTEDPIPAPTTLRPELGEALEAVLLEALARPRAERFSDAASMRRALAEAGGADRPALPGEALGALMRRLFADRIREKEELLRRVRAGSDVTAIPAAEIDVEVELPSVAAPPPTAAVEASRPSRGGARWVAAAAITIAAAAAALWATQGTEPVSAAPPAAAPPAPVVAPSPEAAPPAPPERVTLRIDSEPSGAAVELDGVERGRTPLTLELPRSETQTHLRVSQGALAHEQELVLDRDRDVQLILARPQTTPRRAPRRRRPSPPAGPTEGAEPATPGFELFP